MEHIIFASLGYFNPTLLYGGVVCLGHVEVGRKIIFLRFGALDLSLYKALHWRLCGFAPTFPHCRLRDYI